MNALMTASSSRPPSKSAQIRAVLSLPPDELAQWSQENFQSSILPSDQRLAEHFGVSAALVGQVKRNLPSVPSVRASKTGHPVDTSNIGRTGDPAYKAKLAQISSQFGAFSVFSTLLSLLNEDELLLAQEILKQEISDRIGSESGKQPDKAN